MADADWMKYKQLRGKTLPDDITFRGAGYCLEKLFKRDFYAATGLYRRASDDRTDVPAQIVLKIYHTEPLGLIPLGWLGRRLCDREVFYYQQLNRIEGTTRFFGRFGESGYIREYVPGCHLREYREEIEPGKEFYDLLEEQLSAIHSLGMSHNDLNKPENILVKPDGSPVIIDFQIASRFAWRWPICKQVGRRILRYLQSIDHYHLAKHHRRGRPQDFTEEEVRAAKKKGILLYLHGLLLRRPYRAVRHFFMGRFMRESEAAIISGGTSAIGTQSSHSKKAPPPANAA